jgi:hypothetical protein
LCNFLLKSREIFVIFLRYFCEIFARFLRDFSEIFARFLRDFCEIFARFLWDFCKYFWELTNWRLRTSSTVQPKLRLAFWSILKVSDLSTFSQYVNNPYMSFHNFFFFEISRNKKVMIRLSFGCTVEDVLKRQFVSL